MKTIFAAALLASALSGSAALQIDANDREVTIDENTTYMVEAITASIDNNTARLEDLNESIAELKESSEDCDELGGTDSDALEFDENSWARNILRHALWVETSYIPKVKCKQNQGKLVWHETNLDHYTTVIPQLDMLETLLIP